MVKILLVEDDKSLREIYGVRLLAEGYDIVSAGDGEEALAMAIKEKPQLIISDVMMPKISGFDMLDILRSTTETRDIKVIMMTALSSDDQRARGEQLGADKYLVKSQVGIEDVVRTVHEVLADKEGSTATPAPTAPAAAAAPAPAEAPKPAEEAKPAEPAPAETPAPAEEPAAAPASASPGNEDAGPLPVQPTELAPPAAAEPEVTAPAPADSSLPQPTAPFASDAPRPANLGENALHPDEAVGDVTAPVVPEPAAEPSSEPTANEGIGRPGEKVIQPLNPSLADAGPASISVAPGAPAVSVDPTAPVVPDTSILPPVPPAPDLAAPSVSPDPTTPPVADDSDQSPAVSGPTTPVV